MKIVAVVPFLNEQEHLGTLLASIERQQCPPSRLLLVDDGSDDRSPAIAAEFAARWGFATLMQRPRRPRERDRMVKAHELKAFEWALARAGADWDVAGKLDADLLLPPDFFLELERRFAADPRLGLAGAYLQSPDDAGVLRRQRCPREHVEGENTFYRRQCYDEIAPLPPILGWDTIDELRARMHGWRTESVEIPSGDPIHLRRMGSYNGLLRGYRRAGLAAYAYGAHPLYTGLAGVSRMADRPYVLCGVNYLAGWVGAAAGRAPRAEPAVRRYARAENIAALRRRVLAVVLP